MLSKHTGAGIKQNIEEQKILTKLKNEIDQLELKAKQNLNEDRSFTILSEKDLEGVKKSQMEKLEPVDDKPG